MQSELEHTLGADFQAIWTRFGAGASTGVLSCDVRIALWMWTTPNRAWGSINAGIAATGVSQPPLVRLLDAALAKLPPFRGRVYRGIRARRLNDFVKAYQAGHEFVWPRYTSSSTSLDAAVAFGADVLFDIESRSARLIRLYSADFDEYEALFPRGAAFKVQGTTLNRTRTTALIHLVEA